MSLLPGAGVLSPWTVRRFAIWRKPAWLQFSVSPFCPSLTTSFLHLLLWKHQFISKGLSNKPWKFNWYHTTKAINIIYVVVVIQLVFDRWTCQMSSRSYTWLSMIRKLHCKLSKKISSAELNACTTVTFFLNSKIQSGYSLWSLPQAITPPPFNCTCTFIPPPHPPIKIDNNIDKHTMFMRPGSHNKFGMCHLWWIDYILFQVLAVN